MPGMPPRPVPVSKDYEESLLSGCIFVLCRCLLVVHGHSKTMVCVGLVATVKGRNGKGGSLPTGVAELRKRGYRSVTEKLDLLQDERGLFDGVHQLPDWLLQDQRDQQAGGAYGPHGPTIVAIGVDPGQKSIAVSVRARVSPDLTAADLKRTAVDTKTADFKYEALAKNSQRYWKMCRKRDPQLDAAENLFTPETSLRRPGAPAANYATVTYQTLSVRARHYLSHTRRIRTFDAYRARERAVAWVARDILGPPDPSVRKVVFFGKAEFGSGSRGPIPRKRLIRHLASLAPVVLTNEHRTSITCPQDRAPLHRLALGSRVFCCANARPEVPVESQCNVRAIDRDHSGAANIVMCGVEEMLYGVRPPEFCRGPAGFQSQDVRMRASLCCRRGVARHLRSQHQGHTSGPRNWGCSVKRSEALALSQARTLTVGSLQLHHKLIWQAHGGPAHDMREQQLQPKRIVALSSAIAESSQTKGTLHKWYRVCRALLRSVLTLLGWSPIVAAGASVALLNKLRLAPQSLIDGWWSLALWAVEMTGPAYIKLVQWASSRPDLFPRDVCTRQVVQNCNSAQQLCHRGASDDTLACLLNCSGSVQLSRVLAAGRCRLGKLHANTTPHSWRSTVKALDRAFGPQWRDSFDVPDTKPIGSGCVAQHTIASDDVSVGVCCIACTLQVYKGVVKTANGDMPVAVKVIHPAVKAQIEMDVDIMRGVAAVVEALVPRADVALARNARLGDMTYNCGSAAARCAAPSRDFPMGELVAGNKHNSGGLADIDPRHRKALANVGLKAFLKMLFLDNFVHGDLHPGNILIGEREGRGGRKEPMLMFLDAGIVTELSRSDRRNFIDLFHAIATGNGREAGNLLIARSRSNQCEDPKAFVDAVDKLVSEALSSGLTLSKVHVGQLIGTVLSLCAQHRVKLESNFVSVVIAIGVLEGVGRALDPEINILKAALPVLVQAKMRGNV
ncbi:hypothetical protein JKP88DRAFT_265801 [Tribonema minus]|uniref:ABC1 atypical kinase-like domain-containing protein n=1 Tax=Tribonema minus TaxID=303371 RepID=A0A835YQT5_9STRA|nr:hypothetical protein JKP88DRAFT_265801 [Tribonema minus]